MGPEEELRVREKHLNPSCPIKAPQSVDAHCCYRLRQWLCRKHKVRGTGTGRYPDEYLYGTLGLVRLAATTPNFPWRKA